MEKSPRHALQRKPERARWTAAFINRWATAVRACGLSIFPADGPEERFSFHGPVIRMTVAKESVRALADRMGWGLLPVPMLVCRRYQMWWVSRDCRRYHEISRNREGTSREDGAVY